MDFYKPSYYGEIFPDCQQKNFIDSRFPKFFSKFSIISSPPAPIISKMTNDSFKTLPNEQ